MLDKGRRLYQSSQMIAAIPVLERGLYYDPTNSELNHMLAMAHLTLNNPSEALRYLHRLAKNTSPSPKTHLLLAITCHKLKDLPSAIKAIDKHL